MNLLFDTIMNFIHTLGENSLPEGGIKCTVSINKMEDY